ncbi:hypothetical protein NPIL_74231 [Nephila pilipes]|uniref:Transposase n=1 Tax=Nephila pilipes TaxID=299642 RepID=A0A8X6PQV5_NEPPI|nr:hypothetical protein NPIL_74231 [Nephila pilipes]
MSKTWEGLKDTGTLPGQNRKKYHKESQDLCLATIAKIDRQLTSVQIARDFDAATGTRLYRFTVSSRLHKRGLYAEKIVICIPLTPAAKCARLLWYRDNRDWSTIPLLFGEEFQTCYKMEGRRPHNRDRQTDR